MDGPCSTYGGIWWKSQKFPLQTMGWSEAKCTTEVRNLSKSAVLWWTSNGLTIWLFNTSPWKITMLLSSVNHLILWAIYTMAMLVITRGYDHLSRKIHRAPRQWIRGDDQAVVVSHCHHPHSSTTDTGFQWHRQPTLWCTWLRGWKKGIEDDWRVAYNII